MRELEKPTVYMIGEPSVNKEAMRAYLEAVDPEAPAWIKRLEDTGAWYELPGASLLTEFMGRLCYKSWAPGINANVTKIREDHGDYILNVLRSGHGSILHHAMLNFVIRGGSRVFTAEMNRHQVGVGISEQSMRYVRLNDVEFWVPPGLDPETVEQGKALIIAFENFYKDAVAREGLDGEEASFAEKKALTSKLRRWAPLGIATEEGWSGNIRAIRHVIEMRTDQFAEEEIRIIADQIGALAKKSLPAFFGDYTQEEIVGSSAPMWETPHRKV